MLTFSALMILMTTAITKDFSPTTINSNKYLIKAELKQSTSESELKKNFSNLAHLVRNGYNAYRITYNTTDIKGKPVVASGAVFIPDVKTALPMLNYNHGTYFPSNESKAPSYFASWNPEMSIGKLFSASGYLVVMPDYIGYGSTKNLKHPYGAYYHIGATTIDMLKAVKELCEQQKITLSGKNFFSGWSEGAAVALATVRQLEQTHTGLFTPTATVANAGPYYSSAFVDHILDSKVPLTYMTTYAWVLQSYNWIYDINKPYSYYFSQPAAANLEKNPESAISHDPSVLFTAAFRKSFKNGEEVQLANALQANDLWNWKPASRMVLCHGDKDDYVPLFNSEKAYKEMKAAGADVSLRIFKGHSHSSSAFNYLEAAFSTFESLR